MRGTPSGDRDLVQAVDLLHAHVHALAARRGQVLADVVGPEWQLAVAAVGEHGELYALGAAVVEQGVDGGAYGAAGVEDVVHQHDRGALDREVDVRGVHHRLGGGVAAGQVVAVEADVDVAERHRLADELGHQLAQPGGQHGAATVDPDDRETAG